MNPETLTTTSTNHLPVSNGVPMCPEPASAIVPSGGGSEAPSVEASIPLSVAGNESVPGHLLLDELARVLNRFLVLPKWAAETIALWILHTYAFELRDVTTYLGIESPEKRCGKTTLLGVLGKLVNRPVAAANISSPAFFRVIEEMRPTLLIDEADTFLNGNDELRGILNAGYRRDTAFVMRVANQSPSSPAEKAEKAEKPKSANVPTTTTPQPTIAASEGGSEGGLRLAIAPSDGGSSNNSPGYLEPATINSPTINSPTINSPTRLATFSCWCPKVLAKIGCLPDTLADRCIVVRMHRKIASEERERLRGLDTTDLRRQCLLFVADHGKAIAATQPSLPPALNDRAADIWEPLFVLADLAGGAWPQTARSAAVALTAAAQDTNPIGSLLMDICVSFGFSDTDRLFTRTLLAFLRQFPDRPWADLRKGKEITPLWLAAKLAPYEIRPRTLWLDGTQAKGYLKDDFEEVFRRYIPHSEFEAIKEQYQRPKPEPNPTPTAEAAPSPSQNQA
jgi:hypothetical protein